MIDRPVFIVGNIRSGTTILYHLVAVHPDVCWFSYSTDSRPTSPLARASLRLLDAPVVGPLQRRAVVTNRPNRLTMHVLPWPSEGDRIYHEVCGFGRQRDGLETAMTPAMASCLRSMIEAHLRASGRTRFLSKQTANNRRLDLLERMFPDAVYVHLIRDGRAVASSMLKEPWWPDTYVWWLGKKASAWAPAFRDPAELAAAYWKRTVEVVREFGARVGNRYLEVRYERLTQDPRQQVARILDHAGLAPDPRYLRSLPATLAGMDSKWRTNLSERQQAVVLDAIGAFLRELGYAA
jgi:hypothetical protein